MFSNKDVADDILCKRNILKQVSEYAIYNYYIPVFKIGDISHSPFREDLNPSFGIFIGKYGDLTFNDFKLGGGDCITFVALLEKVTRYSAMLIINKIFKLNLLPLKNTNTILPEFKTAKASLKNSNLKKKTKPKISIKLRDWNDNDKEYFSPLNYKKLQIYPIKFYWIDNQLFNTDKLAYAFRYDTNIYKIYQPNLNTKKGKWWTNIDSTIQWFGHTNLNYEKTLLYVCSSNKDASVLHQLGYNAIAPHTEAQMFSQEQYDYYSKYFDKIIIFYDNDDTGIKKATKFSEVWDLDYIYLEDLDTKDPFEFIKQYGLNELNEFLKQYI